MKILGNRVLVSQVIPPSSDTGFKTVEVQNDFIYKGKVEQVNFIHISGLKVGDVVLFARNSPDTQDVEEDGKKLKVINFDDIISIL